MTDLVSVSVTRSGGLLGATTNYSCVVADLSIDRAEHLCELAEQLDSATSPSDNERDAFTYTIHIHRTQSTQDVTAIETALSPAQRALIDFVTTAANA